MQAFWGILIFTYTICALLPLVVKFSSVLWTSKWLKTSKSSYTRIWGVKLFLRRQLLDECRLKFVKREIFLMMITMHVVKWLRNFATSGQIALRLGLNGHQIGGDGRTSLITSFGLMVKHVMKLDSRSLGWRVMYIKRSITTRSEIAIREEVAFYYLDEN